MTSQNPSPIKPDFRKYIEATYSPVPRDDLEKIIDNLITILEMGQDRALPLKSVLEHVAKTVSRLFAFGDVAIGLKERGANLWKYEVFYGFTEDIRAKLRKVTYDRADMFSQDTFPHIRTGRFSELNPFEGIPQAETDIYNRPFKLGQPRQSLDEFHVGDYYDFWMYDEKKEIIGWIEALSPRSGKQPPRVDVRWMELFASACAFIVQQRWLADDLARR